MINRYPFNDGLFWTMLVNTVKTFLATTVEGQGATLLDREITDDDIDFMKSLKLEDMEFVVPNPDAAGFTIKHKNNEQGVVFSNRDPSRGEMRAGVLREQLLLRKKQNSELTLYEALDDIFRGDIRATDLLNYFLGAVSYNEETRTHIPESDKQLIRDIARELVRYKKSYPDATDEEMIAHGKNYTPPSLATKFFGLFLFALGITIALAPIPGLAQLIGTWLAAIGGGVSAGTITLGLGLAAAAVGLGIFGFASRPNPKIRVSHEENHADVSTFAKQEEDSAVGSSVNNTPGESPVDRDFSDLDGFPDRVNAVREISRPDRGLSEEASRLVSSISTGSIPKVTEAKKLPLHKSPDEEEVRDPSNHN